MKGRVTLGETQGGEGGGTANTNPRQGQRGWSPKVKRKDRRGAGASPHPRPARPTPSRHLDRRSCWCGSTFSQPPKLRRTGRGRDTADWKPKRCPWRTPAQPGSQRVDSGLREGPSPDHDRPRATASPVDSQYCGATYGLGPGPLH